MPSIKACDRVFPYEETVYGYLLTLLKEAAKYTNSFKELPEPNPVVGFEVVGMLPQWGLKAWQYKGRDEGNLRLFLELQEILESFRERRFTHLTKVVIGQFGEELYVNYKKYREGSITLEELDKNIRSQFSLVKSFTDEEEYFEPDLELLVNTSHEEIVGLGGPRKAATAKLANCLMMTPRTLLKLVMDKGLSTELDWKISKEDLLKFTLENVFNIDERRSEKMLEVAYSSAIS